VSAPLQPEFSADRQLRELILLAEGAARSRSGSLSVNRRSFLVGRGGRRRTGARVLTGLVLAARRRGRGARKPPTSLLPTRSCA
jgi:hypothetical protein